MGNGLNGLPKKNRRRLWLQTAALLLALILPFGLYLALEGGQAALAWAAFGGIALAMGLAGYAG